MRISQSGSVSDFQCTSYWVHIIKWHYWGRIHSVENNVLLSSILNDTEGLKQCIFLYFLPLDHLSMNEFIIPSLISCNWQIICCWKSPGFRPLSESRLRVMWMCRHFWVSEKCLTLSVTMDFFVSFVLSWPVFARSMVIIISSLLFYLYRKSPP